jgi:hypothetical protein
MTGNNAANLTSCRCQPTSKGAAATEMCIFLHTVKAYQ